LGNVEYRLGSPTRGRSFYEESLAIRRDLRDRQRVAASLIGLGNVARVFGERETARSHYEEVLMVQQEIQGKKGMATTLRT
jgi:hypothetical protein